MPPDDDLAELRAAVWRLVLLAAMCCGWAGGALIYALVLLLFGGLP
jgi:hypothetical protein